MKNYRFGLIFILCFLTLVSVYVVLPKREAPYLIENPSQELVQEQESARSVNYIPTEINTPISTKSIVPTPPSTAITLQWGSYVGDDINDLPLFESLVGKKVDLYAVFVGWNDDDTFPFVLSTKAGADGKTLVIFWETSFGYDAINNGDKDSYIKQFALDAKTYGYPVILSPFEEMNLNEEAWGYGMNGNTAAKFKTAWIRTHNIFKEVGAMNVKFALTFNNVTIPDIPGNKMSDYYPGDIYVDYIGLDGFNFNDPWLTFAQVFDEAIADASQFNKPIYILSTGSWPGPQKAKWITDGLGAHVKTYPNVLGWVWFNENKPGDGNWLVNSDKTSLEAFKAVLP